MDYERFILVFTSIIYEALPFIVFGVVIAGLLEEFVPQQFIARIIPRSRPLAIGMGGLLGGVFPMCECGIIPIMRRLLRKGLPLSVCVAYMLAGPIINIVVILSTYVAFTNKSIFESAWIVVALRVGLAFVTAFVTALIVERAYKKYGNALLAPQVVRGLTANDDNGEPRRRSAFDRINNITATALGDFVDIMAFLILGATLAASGREVMEQLSKPQPTLNAEIEEFRSNGTRGLKVVKTTPSDTNGLKEGDVLRKLAGKSVTTPADIDTALRRKKPAEDVSVLVLRDGEEAEVETRLNARQVDSAFVDLIQNNVLVAILLMMGVAVVFCLCSEADAFVAANFPVMWPGAAKLAFLVFGPMMDIKLYLMYTRIFRPRLIWTIILSVALQVIVYCLITHYVSEYLMRSH